MNIEPVSFSIGLAIGIAFVVLLQVKVIRRMALSLKKLGVEFGIEADDEKGGGGVKIGDVGGNVSGDIAGRDINKNSNFYKNVQAAINAGRKTSETMLVRTEHVRVDFPDTVEGQHAAGRARGFAKQVEFFPTDDSQRMLLPYVQQFERDGWKVSAIRWSDNGNNGFYVEFSLEQPFKRNA